MKYFGTNIGSLGHFFWDVKPDRLENPNLRFEYPFNPEEMPYKAKNELIKKGTVKFYQINEYTVCAIEGSCSDRRMNTKSVFFTKKLLTYEAMRNEILNYPILRKIIDKMPFKVEW